MNNQSDEYLPVFDKKQESQNEVFSWYHHFIIFLVGFLLLGVFASALMKFFEPLVNAGASNFDDIMFKNTMVSFTAYLLMLLLLSAILWYYRQLKVLFSPFITVTPYLKGLFYGFLVIMLSVSYTALINLIVGPQDSNQNQQAIELVITSYPVLNFFWIVIFGPIVEELIYRFGLFNGLLKINRILAYVISGLIFGFIHFTIPETSSGAIDYARLTVELLNIPSYILSGLFFAYIYEKEGFAVSAGAHITNNLVSFIVTVISPYVK